jgi:hypothetical protein
MRQQRAVQEHNQRIADLRAELQQNMQFRHDVGARAANAWTEEEKQQLAQEWHEWDLRFNKASATCRRICRRSSRSIRTDMDGPSCSDGKLTSTATDKLQSTPITAADKHATTPRNPRDPKQGGLGLTRYSQPYYRRMDDLLGLYAGQLFNAPYDSAEKALTPDEAAKISGLTNRDYNRAMRTLQGQGRNDQD